MVWKLILELNCDVCGNELETKYPPTHIGYAPPGADNLAALNVEALGDLKEKRWTRPMGHDDQWGNPITARCAECTDARRWK